MSPRNTDAAPEPFVHGNRPRRPNNKTERQWIRGDNADSPRNNYEDRRQTQQQKQRTTVRD